MEEPKRPQGPAKEPMGYRRDGDGQIWRNGNTDGVRTYPIAATDDQPADQPAKPQSPPAGQTPAQQTPATGAQKP